MNIMEDQPDLIPSSSRIGSLSRSRLIRLLGVKALLCSKDTHGFNGQVMSVSDALNRRRQG